MIQYLVILLDDLSTSYCHYENDKTISNVIPLDILKQGIRYAMLENLSVQFVYPETALPDEYNEVIESIDHCKIVPSTYEDKTLREEADVVVFSDWISLDNYHFIQGQSYILRTSKDDFFNRHLSINKLLEKASRINVVLTDVETFNNDDFDKYRTILTILSEKVEELFVKGKYPQLNLLTDRMLLSEMNNCDAGVSNITLAPDGNFYICPAFYNLPNVNGNEKTMDEVCHKGFAVGNIENGVDIRNAQLYRLDHAPLCRNCDAYQCKRCIWLNRQTTCEVNTPSHEQCVVAHLERNASRLLLNNLRKKGNFLPGKEDIKEIYYLDPFDVREDW